MYPPDVDSLSKLGGELEMMIVAHVIACTLYSFLSERPPLRHCVAGDSLKGEICPFPSVRRIIFSGIARCFAGRILIAQSVYALHPEDSHAVYLTAEEFGARGNGVDDDSDSLQRAIDRVQETTD
jgi:hypothetical protein